MLQPERVGMLLSKSTTTGWFDWMHGELWLFPDGILRIPVGWTKTLLCLGYFFDPMRATPRAFDAAEFYRMITDARNRWIPTNMLVSAELRHTLGADELRAHLADGRTIQLLWLTRDGAFDALQRPLYQWLGPRLLIEP